MVQTRETPRTQRIAAGCFPLVGVLLLASGCSAGAAKQPQWPQQPSPAYPDPSQASADEGPQREPIVEDHRQPGSDSASQLAKTYSGKKAIKVLKGKATYYADSLAGNHTANGDVYDPAAFTAAHKKLPFGTIVRVIREETNAATYVRINDRGPFAGADRIIDLSKAAARELAMLRAGVVKVRVEVVSLPEDG